MLVHLRVFFRFGNDGQNWPMTNNDINMFQHRFVFFLQFKQGLGHVWVFGFLSTWKSICWRLYHIIFPFLSYQQSIRTSWWFTIDSCTMRVSHVNGLPRLQRPDRDRDVVAVEEHHELSWCSGTSELRRLGPVSRSRSLEAVQKLCLKMGAFSKRIFMWVPSGK